MNILVNQYIEDHIKTKRDISKLDQVMLKSINCHKYWNEKAEYMIVDYDEDLENYIFTPLGKTAYDEIENE